MKFTKNIFLILSVVAVALALLTIIYKPSVGSNLTKEIINQSTTQSIIKSPYNIPLTIGEKEIMVEVVNTADAIRQGMSGRTGIEENEGMLFDFGYKDTQPTFWMKDMLISLDIIWINDGEVVGIERQVPPPAPNTPNSKIQQHRAPTTIDYVLEVKSGFSDRNNIEVGSLVKFDI